MIYIKDEGDFATVSFSGDAALLAREAFPKRLSRSLNIPTMDSKPLEKMNIRLDEQESITNWADAQGIEVKTEFY